jgi:hypothetical protein
LRELVYQGDTSLVYVDLADGTEIVIRASTRSGAGFDNFKAGDSLNLGLLRDDTVIVSADEI